MELATLHSSHLPRRSHLALPPTGLPQRLKEDLSRLPDAHYGAPDLAGQPNLTLALVILRLWISSLSLEKASMDAPFILGRIALQLT